MLKLKFQYFGQLTGKADSVEKFSMLGKFNSVAQSCPTLATTWTAAHQAPLFFTVSQSLLKLMSIESVVPSNHLTLFHPLLLLPSVFVSIFSSVSSLYIRWPNYWSFSFSISPSNEDSGLFPLRLTGWTSLQSKGFSRVFPDTTVQKHQFLHSLQTILTLMDRGEKPFNMT